MTQQGIRASGSGKTVVSMEISSNNGIVLGLKAVKSRAVINFEEYMKNKAKEIEAYMKGNHPWRNRTGRAEAGLHTVVDTDKQGSYAISQIGLYHDEGTWYWRHLEFGMGRRFAIIQPTQRIYAPKLLNGLNLSNLYRFAKNPRG
mgnify:CR=1 FL=1